ncbi:MAG TPA: CHC2 zinc finger domain-containing protein [Candidatus Tectomicrobia bacterium]
MASYIDFDGIKANVTFQHIFAHYGIAVVRERGSELTIHCPFHNDTRPSCKANVERGVFHCFGGCGAKGDLITFVQRKEGIATDDRNRDRVAAARLIVRWFGIAEGEPQETSADLVAVRAPERVAEAHDSEGTALEENAIETSACNPVLTFRLKLDPSHAYLQERGLRPDTIAHFGLGYCNRGLMKGRIAIPIENGDGLVGYAGRWPGERGWPDGEEKYQLPPGFKKSLELYNLGRVPAEARYVVLVEGYWSVFWLWQELGMENVVAAMGASLAPVQQALLSQRFRGVQIFFDGDATGKRSGIETAATLVHKMWVRVLDCPPGLQPDKLSVEDMKRALDGQFQREGNGLS